MKKLKDLKIGEIFGYGQFEWIKLDETEGGILAIAKDQLDEREFDEETNDWGKSSLRKRLNQNFLYELIDNGAKEDDFLRFERDLTAEDGTKDYGRVNDRLSLITCNEYQKYKNLIPNINSWWWTLTPVNCQEKYSCPVRFVNHVGSLDWSYAYYGLNGVRPLCNLKSEILVPTIEDIEDEEEAAEKTLTEKKAVV